MLLALVIGGFVSLFTAGPALFADGPLGERVTVLGFSVLAFALVGLAIGLPVRRLVEAGGSLPGLFGAAGGAAVRSGHDVAGADGASEHRLCAR